MVGARFLRWKRPKIGRCASCSTTELFKWLLRLNGVDLNAKTTVKLTRLTPYPSPLLFSVIQFEAR